MGYCHGGKGRAHRPADGAADRASSIALEVEALDS